MIPSSAPQCDQLNAMLFSSVFTLKKWSLMELNWKWNWKIPKKISLNFRTRVCSILNDKRCFGFKQIGNLLRNMQRSQLYAISPVFCVLLSNATIFRRLFISTNSKKISINALIRSIIRQSLSWWIDKAREQFELDWAIIYFESSKSFDVDALVQGLQSAVNCKYAKIQDSQHLTSAELDQISIQLVCVSI